MVEDIVEALLLISTSMVLVLMIDVRLEGHIITVIVEYALFDKGSGLTIVIGTF